MGKLTYVCILFVCCGVLCLAHVDGCSCGVPSSVDDVFVCGSLVVCWLSVCSTCVISNHKVFPSTYKVILKKIGCRENISSFLSVHVFVAPYLGVFGLSSVDRMAWA